MPPPYLQLFCAFQLRCEAVRNATAMRGTRAVSRLTDTERQVD